MSNNGDGIGSIFINNKNCKGIKVGTSLVKRRYNIPDENGYTILKIKCSTESNILNIFNQLTSNVESVGIFNESNININTNTTLPNLNVDNGSTNQYTTWTLPNGNYKVFIKGEFSIKDSTCEILKVKLQNNLTTGYKMFYNCNIVKANLDYGIKIPDSMTNTESMFENSNIDHTAEINLLTITRCSAMYKNCTNLKKIHINYIEAFNNESTLCPNLSESDYDECFFGCGNIECGNLNSDTNNKPAIFSWANIPYSWGGLGHFNTLEIETNDANGLTLTLAEHLFETIDNNESITLTPETLVRTDWGDGTIDNELSHTYNKSGTYIVKTRLQPNNINTWDPDGVNMRYNKLIKKVINVRNDINNFGGFCFGCTNMEQFNIDNTIQPIDMVGMFYGCQSLTSIDMTKFDTINTIDLDSLFSECTSLNTIIGLENLKTKNVEYMNLTFAGTSITNVDLSKWDCTNIKYIAGLFYGCHKLQSVNLTGWDISKVNDLTSLFNECYELTSIKEIENWDTSNVKSMSSTFKELRTLKTLDLSKWVVSKVKFMDRMFDGCSSLETLGDLSNWTTPALVNADCMFNNTFKMKSLKLTNFDTSNLKQATANTTYAANMFNGCTSLEEYDIVITFGNNTNMPFDATSFDSSIKYITIKGTPDVARMTSFVNILKDQTDTGAILDISQLSDIIRSSLMGDTTLVNNARAKGWTFKQYSLDDLKYFNVFEIEANNANGMSLTLYENPRHSGDITVYATDWGDGTINNESSHTYSNSGSYTIKTKLQSGSNALENNNIIECKNIRNDITNMESFFYNFKALSKISSIPNGVINMMRCFKNCTTFNQPVILPNTLQDIEYIFDGCLSFNQPLIIPEGPSSMAGILKNCRSFNESVKLPSSTTNLYFAFSYCSSFNQPLTIPKSVTSLRFSLQGCSSFNQPITIPNGVDDIGTMFRDCTSFNQPVIIPDTVKDMSQTFYNCTSLNSPITIGSGVTNMIAAFYQCDKFNQDIEIPNSVTNLTYMLWNCNSYNSLVTFNLTSDSDQILDDIFLNTGVSNIKIKGEITNNYMNRILGILVNPTTINILELSNPNILSIIEDETIMNTINTGIRGTSHTLLWAEPTYNYFVVEPNDTNGLLMNLYENEPLAGPMSTLSLSGNQTDWGDGNIDENSTHTYTSGKYLIKTKLQIMNITEYNNYWNNYKGDNSDYIEPAMPITKCMSIRKDIDNMDYFFAGPSIHLVHVCEIPDNIISMNGTFANCIEFNQTFNIPNNVTDISFILIYCNAFNKPLTIPDSIENMMYSFAICRSFNQPVTIPNNVIDCMGLFYMCTSFNQEVILPNKVTNIGGMLAGCTKFNQPLVIPSSVIQAFSLFSSCDAFNQPVTIPRSVANCSNMFADCVAFNKPITFESGSKVESLRKFLGGCSSFNQPLVIPDGVTDISYFLNGFRDNNRVNMAFNSAITIPDSVTDMSYAFYNCTSFNQPVHISNNCTTMEACFNYCHEFNQPLEIPSSVTNISHGIYNCTKMESKVTFNFNAESTINFDETSFFSSPIKAVKIKGYCSNNRLINLSDNLKVASATIDIMELSNANILSIIEDSNVKTSIDARGHNLLWKDETYNYFVVQANSTNGMSLTLYENNDKSGDISAYSVDWGDNVIDNNSSHTYSSENKYLIKTKLQPCNQSKHNEYWNSYSGTNDTYMEPAPIVTKCYNIRNDITDLSYFFNSCIYLTEIPEIRSNIINMAFTFDGCIEFNQPITIPSSVTNLFQTFGYCQKFNQPITIPSNASEVAYMFTGCTNFNQYIEIPSQVITIEGILWGAESFNQALTVPNNVIRMMHAFDGCTSLNSRITLGNSITSMQYAFYNCSKLTIFPTLPNSVLDAERCFAHASSLTAIDLSYWNPKDIVTMEYMFAMCSSITSITFNQNCSFENLENIHGIFTYCGALTETNLFDILYNQC